jgi:hypothetical protein
MQAFGNLDLVVRETGKQGQGRVIHKRLRVCLVIIALQGPSYCDL